MLSANCVMCGIARAHTSSGRCYSCSALIGSYTGSPMNAKDPLWDEQSSSSIIGASKNNKYKRRVKGADIDIYDVLRAFDVTCPAIQHAVKKLLAPGQRGHKDRITDLREALASVQRGIEMEEGG